jgi:hypothetical protein
VRPNPTSIKNSGAVLILHNFTCTPKPIAKLAHLAGSHVLHTLIDTSKHTTPISSTLLFYSTHQQRHHVWKRYEHCNVRERRWSKRHLLTSFLMESQEKEREAVATRSPPRRRPRLVCSSQSVVSVATCVRESMPRAWEPVLQSIWRRCWNT